MDLARRPGPSVRVRVQEHVDGGVRRHEDRLSTEEPLEVRLEWPGRAAERVGVTMRTPGHDFELAAGMLHAEGLLVPDELERVAYCTDRRLSREQEMNVVTVSLARPPRHEPAGRGATVTAAASACGVCGADSIDDVLALCDVRATEVAAPVVPAEVLHGLPTAMREQQRVFDSTGGLHAAALFDQSGRLLVLREDVGRHNAVDKVVGSRLLQGLPTAVPVLCVSGRMGFEIVQKAVAAGIGVLAAIGAPSSLAVRLGQESGLGMVGFLRPDRFVVYSGEDRIGS